MKALFCSLLCVLCAAAFVQAQPRHHGRFPIPPTFDQMELGSMFGDNLENGDFKEGEWVVDADGVITSPGHGEIWTKQKYGSFICKFEFDAEKDANAGFLLHASDKVDWIPNAIEIQLLGDAGKPVDYHHCGAFYGYQAPSENVMKPAGEWNEMTVVAIGTRVMVALNGKLINRINTAEWVDNEKSPQGTEIEGKFQKKSLASQAPYGYIGFQGKHSDSIIRYRNIRFAPITEPVFPAAQKAEWEPLFGENLEKAEYDPAVWSVDGAGVLHATKDDAIWAKEKFDDAIIQFEFMTTEDANSGVIIECTDKANWIPNSFEVQIFDSFGKENGMDQCGAIYGRCAPYFNNCKAPGEWNKMTIAMMGPMIEVYMNDSLITRMNKKEWTDPAKNPNGSDVFSWLVNKAPCDTEDSGYIGFQGLHANQPVAYRNIMVKRIEHGPGFPHFGGHGPQVPHQK